MVFYKERNLYLMIKPKKRKSPFLIAEIGVNHNGSLETAYKLIDVAVDAGVDVVKFQSGKAEKVISK